MIVDAENGRGHVVLRLAMTDPTRRDGTEALCSQGFHLVRGFAFGPWEFQAGFSFWEARAAVFSPVLLGR